MFEFRNQPLKAAYHVFFPVYAMICMPFWGLSSIPRGLRPRRSWSLSRALLVRIIRLYIETIFRTSIPTGPGHDIEKWAASAASELQKVDFVWVSPLPMVYVVGEVREIAELNGVVPKRTIGYWFKREGDPCKGAEFARPDEKVILHFHGGGYIMGSAHPGKGSPDPTCGGLLQHCSSVARIFSGAYRLSSAAPFPSANPFPAALLDALSAYHYLIHTAGFRAENIIVSGESAGGHLALVMARYLALHQSPDLPTPGAVLLLYPTVEWVVTHVGRDSSARRNARSDYCGRFFEGYTAKGLLGQLPADAAVTNPWISPASLKIENTDGMFVNFPKTYLCVGDAEICLDSTLTLRDRLTANIGKENVRYNEVKDATHGHLAMAWHEPERTKSLQDISAWVDSL